MKVNVSREGSYIPKWEGNRKQPESEQMLVSYVHLSHNQRNKHIHREKPKVIIEDFETKSDGEIDRDVAAQHSRIEIIADSDDAAILRDMNITIANLEDTEGAPIDTWAKLLVCPQTRENKLAKLVSEISAELSGNAKEKDSKNSE